MPASKEKLRPEKARKKASEIYNKWKVALGLKNISVPVKLQFLNDITDKIVEYAKEKK